MFDYEKELAELNARRDRIEEMKRLRAQGQTLKQIGERFGLTKQRVYSMIGKMEADDE